jgi:hypothetical protein
MKVFATIFFAGLAGSIADDHDQDWCEVTVYEHCDEPIDGWAHLGIGSYDQAELENNGVRIDGISALRFRGSADCKVTLFDCDFFNCESKEFHAVDFPPDECVDIVDDFSDRANSMMVELERDWMGECAAINVDEYVSCGDVISSYSLPRTFYLDEDVHVEARIETCGTGTDDMLQGYFRGECRHIADFYSDPSVDYDAYNGDRAFGDDECSASNAMMRIRGETYFTHTKCCDGLRGVFDGETMLRVNCDLQCEPDDSKCRTHGDDCWGASNEPQECADGYIPAVDYSMDKLLCFAPGCPAEDISCEPDDSKCVSDDCMMSTDRSEPCTDGYHPGYDYDQNRILCYKPGCDAEDRGACVPDDSKCRTYGDDCWGASNEPQECADGYLPALDYDEDKLLCYPPGCEAKDKGSCDPDDSKCRTYGGDCWGASNEPQECADDYIPIVDYDNDKLLCFHPSCPNVSCEHNESKCRTDFDDCYGANSEPQVCADGYQPYVNYEEDYLYCFPPHCVIPYNDKGEESPKCRDCSTHRARSLLFARLPCC